MDVYSPRQLLINNLQSSQQNNDGAWKKLIKKTSNDGFVHGNPRPHSPIKIATYTKGSWEDFIRRSDMIIENKGIKIPPHIKDHFEIGQGPVALIDEKDIFNLRGQKRINLAHKESHVFDAYRKKFSTNIMSDIDRLQWIERFRSDYTKYHHSEYPSFTKSISQVAFETETSKQKIIPKTENSYLAISEAKKQKRERKQIKQQISTEVKSCIYMQQNTGLNSRMQSARKPFTYEQYKSMARAKSPSQLIQPIQLQQTEVLNAAASPSRQQQNQQVKQEIGFDQKKKVRSPKPTSDLHKQFMEYKKDYDSVQLG